MSSITVQISRRDLVAFNLAWFASPQRLLRSVAMMSVIVGFFAALSGGRPETLRHWLALGGLSLAAAAAILAAGFVIGLFWVLFASRTAPGVLGRHTYTFTEGGLLESTDANDTLVKWGGARSVSRKGGYLLIEIAPYLFHIVPHRSFSSEADFREFCERASLLAGNKP